MNTPADLTRILDPETLELPKKPRVVEIRTEPYVDSAGDDELRILVILEEATTGRDRTWKKLEPIQDAIFHALRNAHEPRFPYTRFLKRSELG